MLKIVPMTAEHLRDIKTPFEFAQAHKSVLASDKSSPAYTGIYDGEIIAVGGASIMWGGVGEAWYVVSSEGLKKPFIIAKYAGYMLDYLQEENKLHRLQASVAKSDLVANRFANWLGFKNEGIMDRYGPDKTDYVRYARLA